MEILPNIHQWDKTGAPDELMLKMGQSGLMGIRVGAEWGGAGADFVAYVVAMEEISAADGGIANLMAALRDHATGAQKQRFFPQMAKPIIPFTQIVILTGEECVLVKLVSRRLIKT